MEEVKTRANSQIYLTSTPDRPNYTSHLPTHLNMGNLLKNLVTKVDPGIPEVVPPEKKLDKYRNSKPYGELLNSFRPQHKPYFMTPFTMHKSHSRPYLNSARKRQLLQSLAQSQG